MKFAFAVNCCNVQQADLFRLFFYPWAACGRGAKLASLGSVRAVIPLFFLFIRSRVASRCRPAEEGETC